MRWLVCVLGACLSIGCTDRASDDGGDSVGDGDGDGGSVGDTSGTGSGSATRGGSGDATGSTDAGDTTAGPTQCLPPAPQIGPAVTVRIVNEQALPVYIPDTFGCTTLVPFDVVRDGTPVPWQYEECTSCEAAIEGICFCPAACPIDSVLRLDPGGTWEGSWPGSETMPLTLTPECTDEFCGPQCATSIAAVDGAYTVEVQTAIDVDCFDAQCDCVGAPDPGGWCRVNGTLAGDQAGQVQPFSYPSETSVEVVI